MAESTDSGDNRAYHLYAQGRDARLRNQPAESLELQRRCLAEARRLADTVLCGAVLFEIGFILTSLDRYDEATDAYEECLLYYDRSSCREELTRVLVQLGQVYRLVRRTADAADAYRRLRDACRALGDWRGEGVAASMLGQVLVDQGDCPGGFALMVRGLEQVRAAAPEEAELMTEHVKWFGRAKLPPDEFRRLVTLATTDPALLAALLG